jgi:hypothetical protein
VVEVSLVVLSVLEVSLVKLRDVEELSVVECRVVVEVSLVVLTVLEVSLVKLRVVEELSEVVCGVVELSEVVAGVVVEVPVAMLNPWHGSPSVLGPYPHGVVWEP